MRKTLELFAGVSLLVLVLTGCDTSQNTPSPAKYYFLKYYGTEGNQTAVDVEVNPDGTFVIFGNSGPGGAGNNLLFLVKADQFGNQIWKRTFGGSLGNDAKDVTLTNDGNIIIVANTNSAVTSAQEILVQSFDNASGSTIASNVITGIGVYPPAAGVKPDKDAQSITQLNNGDFVVTGSSVDLWTATGSGRSQVGIEIRLDGSLNIVSQFWVNHQTNSADFTVSTSMVQLVNDSIYTFGFSNRNGDFDFNFLPTDAGTGAITQTTNTAPVIGEPLTSERLGSVTYNRQVISDQTMFYFAGISTTADGLQSDIYVAAITLALDPANNIVFKKKAGASLNTGGSQKACIELCSTGGFFVLTNDFSTGNTNLILYKFTGTGDVDPNWTPRTYGGVGEDFAGAVRELPDGKLIISGTFSINGETKMTLMKLNKNGQFDD